MQRAYKKGGDEICLALALLNAHPELTILYDIGANRGEWSRGVAESVDRQLQQFLFDPLVYLERERERNCPSGKHFTVMLSDEKKEVDWYDRPGGGGYGASYFKESSVQYVDVKPSKRQTETLDALVTKHTLPIPHFVKIDTQGSELDILRGGSELIKNVNFVQLEINKSGKSLQYGSPTYEECTEYMKSIGFNIHSDNSIEKERKWDFDVLFERIDTI